MVKSADIKSSFANSIETVIPAIVGDFLALPIIGGAANLLNQGATHTAAWAVEKFGLNSPILNSSLEVMRQSGNFSLTVGQTLNSLDQPIVFAAQIAAGALTVTGEIMAPTHKPGKGLLAWRVGSTFVRTAALASSIDMIATGRLKPVLEQAFSGHLGPEALMLAIATIGIIYPIVQIGVGNAERRHDKRKISHPPTIPTTILDESQAEYLAQKAVKNNNFLDVKVKRSKRERAEDLTLRPIIPREDQPTGFKFPIKEKPPKLIRQNPAEKAMVAMDKKNVPGFINNRR